MGLLIVKRTVDIYGAALNIRSIVGQGTAVEIIFPL